MARCQRHLRLPDDAITVTAYGELDHYLRKFAERELGLVLLLGRHGTGKTEHVKRIVGCDPEETHRQGHPAAGRRVLYAEGHAQPFGLYCELWEYRDCLVILDDLDKLYARPDCVRLLKPLCNTQPVKRITWYSNATLTSDAIPAAFTTTSNVILIANEWHTLNANVRALEDRGITICFAPTNIEIHHRVACWFDDQVVFDFIAEYLSCAPEISMRHYEKGRMLRRAGIPDWRTRLLQMILPDKRLATVAALQAHPDLSSDKDRIEQFIRDTGQSRATYYRLKQDLPVVDSPPPRLVLVNASLPKPVPEQTHADSSLASHTQFCSKTTGGPGISPANTVTVATRLADGANPS